MPSLMRLVAAIADRRQPTERREDDRGPPDGWRDRRRTVERRLPTVEEGVVSLGEWQTCLDAFVACRRARNPRAPERLGGESGETA